MIYERGLIKGMIWKMTCYDMFIIYFDWFVPKCLINLARIADKASLLTASGMLLHAFPSMSVSSLREFPENCVYRQDGFNCFFKYLHRKWLTTNFDIDGKACNNIPEAVNKLALSASLDHSCETGWNRHDSSYYSNQLQV
jgi:hypothetical protein